MAKRKSGTNQAKALPQDIQSSVSDEEHSKLIDYVNEADEATTGSRKLSEKCRSYYDTHGQWTDAERAKLASQKQAATVVNRVKPKVDSLMGMERANRTTAKAFPRTPKHTQGATAATESVRFVLQDNMYERLRSDTWENLLIEGTGGLDITVKAKDQGYKIVIKHIMWDRRIWDPHSRRKDFSDAKYLGQVVWMDYEDAVNEYPSAKDILESMQTGSSTYDDKPRWMDNTRRRVKIVELYYHKDGDWWYACFTRGGYCEKPMISPYKNEEGETEYCYEFASLFVDREGCRYGSLRQVLDVQDEINKRRSKALHLMSVRQTFGTKGSVEDVNKARAELAKPDGHVEFAYGELNKDFGVLPTGDMAQAQFNLLGEAKIEMDIVGANAATMGKDKTVQSGVALRQRALTGQTELAPMFDMLKNLDIRVYRKVWNRVKQYWKEKMWLRVTDDENNLKFVGLNKPVTKGEQVLQQAQEQMAGQKMPPEQMQQMMATLQQQIAMDPMMEEIVSTENDIVNLDVDIVMDDAPDTVTQEVEDFQAMAEMVKSGFPLPPEAVIMASPLSNKDKIIKMMKESPQVPPKVQEQIEQMKVVADSKSESEKAAIKKQQLTDEYELKRQAQEREAQLARDKALDEYNLKATCAERDHNLEKEMCDKKHGLEKDKMAFDMKAKADAMLPDDVRVSMMKNKVAETDVMPQLMEGLQAAFGKFGEAMDTLADLQKQTIAAIQAPKNVSVGAVQKDAAGNVIGATVRTSAVPAA